MSFKTQIESYVGATDDDAALTKWLTQGFRLMTDKLSLAKAEKIVKNITDAGSGVNIKDYKLFRAHKSNRGAVRVPPDLAAAVVDTDSIHYAISTSPVWYVDGDMAYVKPGGGTIKGIQYPIVDINTTTLIDFPEEAENGGILYAAIQMQIRNITTLVKTTMGGITYSAPTNATAPSAPAFVYTDATGQTISATTVTISNTLTFNPPAFSGTYTNMDTALSNLDVELASGHANKLNLQLSEFDKGLQNSLADFNKQAKQYDNELSEAITQAQITAQEARAQAELTTNVDLQNKLKQFEKEVQEYQAKLGKYQTDVQDYASQVNEEVSRISAILNQYVSMSQGYFAILENLKTEFTRILEIL